MNFICRLQAFALLPMILALVTSAQAQGSFPVYTDHLVNGFQDWGWAPHNYTNTAPAHAGANSVSVNIVSAYQGLQIVRNDLDSAPYNSVSFWINGGANGGQQLKIYGLLHVGSSQNTAQLSFSLGTLATNLWQQFTVPLSALGVADKSNFTGFVIQDRVGIAQPTFFLDDLQLNARPAPALVKLGLEARQTLRGVDARFFGVNTAVWDGNFDTASTSNALKEMGCLTLRFPGGSLSDEYHWATGTTGSNTWQWATSFRNFMHIATTAAAQVFITVNYGTGTPAEAAAWVRSANVTNHCGFKYWEIGNENYGSWETDSNSLAHDPYTYAVRAEDYIQQMKAADPSIKIGVVAVTGEDNFANNSNHPATNPRTGVAHNGWTPVMLTTLKNLGVTPDFIVHHVYPEYTFQESDPLLLQSSGKWAADAADLRRQITDYFGPGGTNIELVCTENNSNSGDQGKQSTSLVNGLYYADSLAQIMKTEFNGFLWWDLRNGTDTSGNMDATLYGWRGYGDLGMINGANTRHPPFYAAKLMQFFSRPGDSILPASSDYFLLSSYAARRTNGELAFLAINKSPAGSLNAQIVLTNFVPWTNMTVRSYGISQDEATRTNGAASAQDISVTNFAINGTNFNYAFPPYSLTLFTFAPAPARLLPVAASANEIVFQLQGQAPSRYAIQSSTNLTSWTAVATNALISDTLNLTNVISGANSEKFWRAVWLP
ncbi:MAG: alpha-L-arabinofuranosidase [Verrucomicrobiota bacterium]